MKKKVQKRIDKAVRAERMRCAALCLSVVDKYSAMGFRHDAERAAGAEEVLKAMRITREHKPHTLNVVSGLTPVYETY